MDFDNDSDEQHIYNIDKGKGKEVETPEPVEEENILPESVEDTESSEEESTVISPSRREEEFIRKDRSLLDFLRILDGFEPLVRKLSSLELHFLMEISLISQFLIYIVKRFLTTYQNTISPDLEPPVMTFEC